ncbi:PD-(D/E)XK nuclease family protein, partial [Aquibium sp. A9E412]|uniref:PD-(D/E)XK nuclease family protein n=1 Tax=Aquibium sp. A9E412 TaxID=2976767 RepID=UPI0025B02AFD
RMLETLPALPAERRAAAAEAYLARIGADWPAALRGEAWASVAAILDDERFAALFAPGSRAEVPVMGTLELGGRPRAVSGTIDRLAVGATTVAIVDYKTNRPAPETLDAVPEAYVAQLALYAALLAPVFPGRKVAAALLFTEAPRLIAVPAERLDAALARLAKA